MPTGYTAAIADGISFKQFALQCARAFGACIEMRDDAMDATIPEEFKPSDFHLKELERAQSDLDRIRSMDRESCDQASSKELRDEKEMYRKWISEKAALRCKYESMLAKVKGWLPPTGEHTELKKFMIEQISGSIDFDCNDSFALREMEKPKPLLAEEWKAREIEKAERSIAYHKKQHAEEVARANGRTQWIKDLRASL